jgi:hypothetical protein
MQPIHLRGVSVYPILNIILVGMGGKRCAFRIKPTGGKTLGQAKPPIPISKITSLFFAYMTILYAFYRHFLSHNHFVQHALIILLKL